MLDLPVTDEIGALPNQEDQTLVAARKLYQQARSRSWLDKVWFALNGGPRGLFDLAQVRATCTGLGYRYLGTQMVSISQICGSANEGRCHDFDAEFRPLKKYNDTRWLRAASAWQRGVKLLPVSLIQVGEYYFVNDGHHRISVARALGQEKIEAEVTIWRVMGPLPWQKPVDKKQPHRRTYIISQRV